MMRKLLCAMAVLSLVLVAATGASRPASAAGAKEIAVAIDKTNFPDEMFRSYVKESFDSDGDDMLSEDEISGATSIDVKWKRIASLEGVEFLSNL